MEYSAEGDFVLKGGDFTVVSKNPDAANGVQLWTFMGIDK
jgi:hypothetical protein